MSTEPILVLVAEDDEVSAQAVRTMLERLKCSVEIVEDGAQAVERFRQRRYDLILMGWQMPIMDGFEATARIRALPRGQATPVIGTTPSRDRAECLAAGMNDLMPKPFQIEKLRLILTRWTAWPDEKSAEKSDAKKADCTCGTSRA
jgi:CheY-like chemotaxis protein